MVMKQNKHHTHQGRSHTSTCTRRDAHTTDTSQPEWGCQNKKSRSGEISSLQRIKVWGADLANFSVVCHDHLPRKVNCVCTWAGQIQMWFVMTTCSRVLIVCVRGLAKFKCGLS